jgi:hypothetical protein
MGGGSGRGATGAVARTEPAGGAVELGSPDPAESRRASRRDLRSALAWAFSASILVQNASRRSCRSALRRCAEVSIGGFLGTSRSRTTSMPPSVPVDEETTRQPSALRRLSFREPRADTETIRVSIGMATFCTPLNSADHWRRRIAVVAERRDASDRDCARNSRPGCGLARVLATINAVDGAPNSPLGWS